MKLLLDENLSRRIVPFLQADYPDSTQIALANMESASDFTANRNFDYLNRKYSAEKIEKKCLTGFLCPFSDFCRTFAAIQESKVHRLAWIPVCTRMSVISRI